MLESAPPRPLLRAPFLPYWLGQTVSNLGERIRVVALPAVVLAVGGGAGELATLAAWSSGTQLALLLAGGLLVDRAPRRAVMLVTDLLRAALLGLTAFLLARHALNGGLLIALAVTLGACSAVFLPAAASIMPTLVEEGELVRANALNNLGTQVTGVIGPAIGGALVALGGASLALGLNALTFLAGALGLFLMRPRTAAGGAQTQLSSIWVEAAQGFRLVLASTWLWLTIAIFAVVNVFAGALNAVLLPLYARAVLGGTGALGPLYSAEALGAVLSALTLSRVRALPRRGVTAYASVLVGGLALATLGLHAPLPLALAALFLSGAGVMVFGVLWEATLQERVPHEALGRVASVDMLGSFALLPLGFVLFGQLVGWISVTGGILLCGLGIAGLALLGLSTRAVRDLR